MNIGKILKAAAVSFKNERAKLITFGVAWGILISLIFLFVFFILGSLGFGLLASFIVFLPLHLSLSFIAIKVVNRDVVNMNDFYLGFKNFRLVSTSQTAIFLKGILFSILGFFIGVVFSALVMASAIYITRGDEIISLLQNGDLESLATYFESIEWMPLAITISNIVSFVFAGLFFIFKGMDKSFTNYISMDVGFMVGDSMEISERFLKANKRSYFRVNFVFLLFFIPIITILFMLDYGLTFLNVDAFLSFSISSVISFVLMGILIVYRHLANYHIFRHYFKKTACEMFEEKLKKVNQTSETDNQN